MREMTATQRIMTARFIIQFVSVIFKFSSKRVILNSKIIFVTFRPSDYSGV